MKVWNFDGVDEIVMGRDKIREIWFRNEVIWRIPPPPPGPLSWVDAHGGVHNLTFVFDWPDHNKYQMTMTVSDGGSTVVAAETSHYGTATDGSGELFMVRTHDRKNVFWVMIDGYERAWLFKQKGFPANYDGVALIPVQFVNERL